MNKKSKPVLISLLLIVVTVATVTAVQIYQGRYLGQEKSADGQYLLKYYSSFNPFVMQWSMPGGSSCKPRWIRLYNSEGDKLNELYTTDCSMEMDANWMQHQLILPDGDTVWELSVNME